MIISRPWTAQIDIARYQVNTFTQSWLVDCLPALIISRPKWHNNNYIKLIRKFLIVWQSLLLRNWSQLGLRGSLRYAKGKDPRQPSEKVIFNFTKAHSTIWKLMEPNSNKRNSYHYHISYTTLHGVWFQVIISHDTPYSFIIKTPARFCAEGCCPVSRGLAQSCCLRQCPLVTIGYQSWHAVVSNPLNYLKSGQHFMPSIQIKFSLFIIDAASNIWLLDTTLCQSFSFVHLS